MTGDINKKIVTALMSVSLFAASVCGAEVPKYYTNTVDTSVCYTGVIIDCRGLGLDTAMSPVIQDVAGHKLYGHTNLNPDVVIRKGMASYAHGFTDSEVARAGSNPVVFKAVSVANHGTYPVIDEADAALLSYSTTKNNYLKNAAVVFVR